MVRDRPNVDVMDGAPGVFSGAHPGTFSGSAPTIQVSPDDFPDVHRSSPGRLSDHQDGPPGQAPGFHSPSPGRLSHAPLNSVARDLGSLLSSPQGPCPIRPLLGRNLRPPLHEGILKRPGLSPPCWFPSFLRGLLLRRSLSGGPPSPRPVVDGPGDHVVVTAPPYMVHGNRLVRPYPGEWDDHPPGTITVEILTDPIPSFGPFSSRPSSVGTRELLSWSDLSPAPSDLVLAWEVMSC